VLLSPPLIVAWVPLAVLDSPPPIAELNPLASLFCPPETVENIRRLWENVHKEDHEICERLQEGRHSEVAEQGGVLSPHWESSVRRFQELVANSIRPALNKNSLQEKNND